MNDERRTQKDQVFATLYSAWGFDAVQIGQRLPKIPAPSIRRALHELVKQGKVVRREDGYCRV